MVMPEWGWWAAGIVAWCQAVVWLRPFTVALTRITRRRFALQTTFTWGRCKSCGRLWLAKDFARNMGCLCGCTKVSGSRPATTLEALRMTLRPLLPL